MILPIPSSDEHTPKSFKSCSSRFSFRWRHVRRMVPGPRNLFETLPAYERTPLHGLPHVRIPLHGPTEGMRGPNLEESITYIHTHIHSHPHTNMQTKITGWTQDPMNNASRGHRASAHTDTHTHTHRDTATVGVAQ